MGVSSPEDVGVGVDLKLLVSKISWGRILTLFSLGYRLLAPPVERGIENPFTDRGQI